MNQRIATLLLSAVCLPAALAQEPPPGQEPPRPKTLELGQRVNAEVMLRDLEGKPQRAGDLMGTITVVNFYSIGCPIQRAWDRRLVDMQADFGRQGVVFLHVASNVDEVGREPPKPVEGQKPYGKVRAHLKKHGLPFRVLVDHGNVVADLFQAKTTPQVYVFGRDGRLCYRGLIDDDQTDEREDSRDDYLRDVLAKLVKGDQVKPFETVAIGCSIKRTGDTPPKPDKRARQRR